MTDPAFLRSLEVDLETNTLRLTLGDDRSSVATEEARERATIDIGAGGRLIGVELAGGYVDVMSPEPGTDHLVRSSDADVAVGRLEESGALVTITIPRRGAGYEITYPSGNQ